MVKDITYQWRNFAQNFIDMCKLKVIIVFVFISSCSNLVFAQSYSDLNENFQRKKGFTFGVGLGGGISLIGTNDTVKTSFGATLPNIKIGYVFNEKFAMNILAPGTLYKYEGKYRGFEGFVLSGQYWVKDKWWVLGGIGLTMDATPFWRAFKDFDSSNFHTGFPALTFATGYEIYRKRSFALDIYYRLYNGRVTLENDGERKGTSHALVFGFNWY
jgi:hypothetical protein